MDDLCMWISQRKALRRRCYGVGIRHPIWFAHSGTIICFSTGQWLNTPSGWLRAILPRRRVMEGCIRWPGLHNPPTSTKLRWFGISWISAQHMWEFLQDCWKSIPGEASWENAKCGYLKNLKNKIYFDLFNHFLFTTWFHMCYFIVLMSLLLFYNVENSK
jgi:hypothetical protein